MYGTMHGTTWSASAREHGIERMRDVAIPVDGGDVHLAGDVFVPDGDDTYPVLLGTHPYTKEFQLDAPYPASSLSGPMGSIESGDPEFYVRRGYAMANVSVRGTGKSEGRYHYGGEQETDDICDVIAWLADQDWCNGKVAFFGISYYAVNAQSVASRNPDALECIFSPYAFTDSYRDQAYHGGILANWWMARRNTSHDNPRYYEHMKEELGEAELQRRIDDLLENQEIVGDPNLTDALENPDTRTNTYLRDVLVNYLDGETDYWDERRVSYENTEIPVYFGADWGIYAFHLPGTFRSWENWEGPKKMMIGPRTNIDRPLYQYQYESLRWFDHWLKGEETGIMDEPPIKLYMPPTGDWKSAEEWPLPETTWTPFFLHHGTELVQERFESTSDRADGLLSEHEIFDENGSSTFRDAPYEHGQLWFETPEMVENVEICGPVRLNLWASTTDTELLLFATLYDVAPDGTTTELTRGWLRGSQRKVDEERSTPWRAFHPHDERQPLEPGEVYEFNVNVCSTAQKLEQGHKLALRIKCSDSDDGDDIPLKTPGERLSTGHLERQIASQVTVYHTHEYPSHLLVPVTGGNNLGTFLSGGELISVAEASQLTKVAEYIQMPKSLDEE